jgi:hypothetical protein
MAAPLLQSYGPGNVDEVLTLSLANMVPGIRDNVYKSNPVLAYIYEKGNGKMTVNGGASLSHGIMYEANSTAMSYSRYQRLDVTPQDGLTRDQWAWAQYAVSISVDGYSERANGGKQKIEDIMAAKKKQAEEALSLRLEQDMFKASPSSTDMQSLATIIASSGTVGGINGTTSTWWASTVVSSGSFAAQGRQDLTTAYNTVSINNPNGAPELIASDQNSFEYYESTLVPHERFTDNKLGDLGFQNLKFKNVPWVWSPQGTSGTIYVISFKGLEFFVHSEADFETTPFVKPVDQDAKTAQILLQCALTTGNRRKLAKLTGVTA